MCIVIDIELAKVAVKSVAMLISSTSSLWEHSEWFLWLYLYSSFQFRHVRHSLLREVGFLVILEIICSQWNPSFLMQDHKGISNVAAADCPLIPLLVPKVEQSEEGAVDQTRIHDHISNLRFSISPTAFFQVWLKCKPLFQLALWLNLLLTHNYTG